MPTANTLDPPTTQRLWTEEEFDRMQRLGLFNSRQVTCDGGIVRELPSGRPFVFTQNEYHKLEGSLFFVDQRVELIGGKIIKALPMNPPHATAIRKTTRVLERIFSMGYDVRVQLPLDLSLSSEPEPDVAVVAGSLEDFATHHPTTAILVVEVSDSTIQDDTHDKASLYAAGGIPEYWVIDLTTNRVLVFRLPQPDSNARFGHSYASINAFSSDDKFSPVAAAQSRVAARELLP